MADSGAQVKQSYEYKPPLSLWIAREHKLCTDLLLHVGELEHYRVVDAHRAVLVVNSPYFEDALVINDKEKIYHPEMHIPDMTEKQVLCILKYIYTKIFEATGMESLLDTLYGAHRFQIRQLVNKCQLLIEGLLKFDPVTSIALINNHKRLYDEDKYLLDLAKSLLQPNLMSILGSEDTQNVSYDTMEVLLDLYQEEIPETAYFEALDRWAIATCRKNDVEPDAAAKRNVAGNLTEKIYFNELSVQYVAGNVQDSGLLNDERMLQLLLSKNRSQNDGKSKITRKEKHIFLTMDQQSTDDREEHVMMSMEWFKKWKTYMENSESSNYPGPVNYKTPTYYENRKVRDTRLKDVDDKFMIKSFCDYLISKYGGQSNSLMTQDQMKSLTVLKDNNKWIDTVRSDSHKLTRAASVINWSQARLTVRMWNVNHEDQSWTHHDLAVSHTLDLKQSPERAAVITILDNMLLIWVVLDDKWRSQIISVDSSSGHVLHKSQVHACRGFLHYCCYKSQVLLPDKDSSSITQLHPETFNILNKWTDKRVRQPCKVCSNKTRAAVRDYGKSISVFTWEDVQLSHEMIYTVEYKNVCNRISLLPDNTLVAFNMSGQWSVWSESGASVHTTVQHPALLHGKKISLWWNQDPVSGKYFLQEFGKLDDDTDIRAIYNMRILMDRLETQDKSQIDKSQLELNKTIQFK